MVDRITTPLIAVGLAALVWMYTRSRDLESIDNVRIPVELQVSGSQADLYDLDVAGNPEVVASFVGPPSRLRELRARLHHGELRPQRVITVPDERLRDPRYAETLRVDAAEIPVPPGVHVVVNEVHNRIPITMTRLVEKQMKVEFRHAAGHRISQVAIEPPTVSVKGPMEVLERQDYLSHPTVLYQLPLDESERPSNAPITVTVALAREVFGRSVRVTPAEVAVKFVLVPDQKDFDLADVPIHFLTPQNFSLRPRFRSEREGFIRLRVRGPAASEKPATAAVKAYVDLTRRAFQPGMQPEEPIQVQLPPGFKLIGPEQPRLPAFELVPLGDGMKPSGDLTPPPVPG